MFTPFDLRGLTLPNRVVMAPMAQYSAEDGDLTDWHFTHYAARAMGGAGLIFTEMTCPTPDARITPACTGLWSDKQEADWATLVDFVHETTPSKVALQLGHAGRKGSTKTPAEGEDVPLASGLAASFRLPPFHSSTASRRCAGEMTARGHGPHPRRIRRRGESAARRTGFDMLELHCAHGYLLASFISPLTNSAQIAYGGGADSRARYPVEVFAAIRDAWPADKPISVRLSCSDWARAE